MKIGCGTVCFRKFSLEEAMERIRRAGYEYVEPQALHVAIVYLPFARIMAFVSLGLLAPIRSRCCIAGSASTDSLTAEDRRDTCDTRPRDSTCAGTSRDAAV